MDVVDQWTGAYANALQFAMRLTHDEFSETLGVARRTVATWHERPDVVLRTEFQRALDTLYDRAPDAVKLRFVRKLRADNVIESGSPDDTSTGGALSVAIAVVSTDSKVLLVCRRDEEPSGITWQFPAGIVKPGATPESTAIRETLAETGVHCSVNKHLGGRVHPLSKVYCNYFLCDYLTGDPMNNDVAENVSVMWVPHPNLTKFIAEDRIFDPVLKALKGEATHDVG